MDHDGYRAAEVLDRGLGRRGFLRATLAMSAAAGAAGAAGCSHAPAAGAQSAAGSSGLPGSSGTLGSSGSLGSTGLTPGRSPILQPGTGPVPGDHYLGSDPAEVLWGYVPNVHSSPALRVRSGDTVTIDTVSHEGILEDQGRDPVTYFGQKGIDRRGILDDAVAIASDYSRTTRDFDRDGPHVVTGPVFVEGARPGDVLRIDTLDVVPRVPYGVVSSRHGKGALGITADGSAPAGIGLDEVMPPIATDGRATGDPLRYGNVSTFVAIENGRGVLPFGDRRVTFPLRPFMGMMGVAFSRDSDLTAASANSIPPTLGGGNIDIRLLGKGSTLYLPVFAEGALFYVGDPHMAMGDGEAALTAMEGSLRGTFRLTVCRPGEGDAPSVAFSYPFGETEESWIPIGLSDPDGAVGGQSGDLDVAMRRAVVNALDFLCDDQGMDRATAYAYLSAAADFTVSQVVDRTVGVHGQIFKENFA